MVCPALIYLQTQGTVLGRMGSLIYLSSEQLPERSQVLWVILSAAPLVWPHPSCKEGRVRFGLAICSYLTSQMGRIQLASSQ